jgi:hypothetical protein
MRIPARGFLGSRPVAARRPITRTIMPPRLDRITLGTSFRVPLTAHGVRRRRRSGRRFLGETFPGGLTGHPESLADPSPTCSEAPPLANPRPQGPSTWSRAAATSGKRASTPSRSTS